MHKVQGSHMGIQPLFVHQYMVANLSNLMFMLVKGNPLHLIPA